MWVVCSSCPRMIGLPSVLGASSYDGINLSIPFRGVFQQPARMWSLCSALPPNGVQTSRRQFEITIADDVVAVEYTPSLVSG